MAPVSCASVVRLVEVAFEKVLNGKCRLNRNEIDENKLMIGHIASKGNAIQVEGPFTTVEMPRLIAAMHKTVSVRGYKDLTLDFSRCTAAYPGPMLAIVARSQAYWAEEVDISLVLPTDMKLRNLFINANWANLIDIRGHPESQYRGYRHVPAIKFKDGNEQHQAVSKILNAVLGALSDFDRADLRAIEWSINEISDNVINHSKSGVGGFIQITNFTGNAKRVEFVVSDAGIGIPASLRQTHPELKSDAEALDAAIREGVTRDKSFGQGNGLFGTWRITQISGGKFEVYSGHGWLISSKQHELRIGNQPIPYNGTIVIGTLRYAQPVDLSDALEFRGRKHTPVDFVEVEYETDVHGNIEFSLTAESAGFGSRAAGERVRRKLVNLARLSEAGKIVVDFDEVPLISSSYADEVFGKLFVEMGPIEFAQTFTFKNIDVVVRQLIDRAVAQRVAQSI